MPATWLTLLALAIVLGGAVIPRVSLDLVAILAVCLLVVGGVLDPAEATAGFGTPTLVIVACMFVLAEALQRTGAARGVERMVRQGARGGARALLLVLLPFVMVLSGFMSNTGVIVLLLPIVVSAAQRAKISPSRLLLPLSYASITGGTLTLVGTTTTLLVDGMLRQAGLPGLGLLEIMPVGLVFCLLAMAYLVIAAPSVLPARVGLVTPVSPETTSQFLSEIQVRPDSPLVGKCLADQPHLRQRIRFLQLTRGEATRLAPFHDEILQGGDVLRVKGSPDEILSLLAEPGLEVPLADTDAAAVTEHEIALAEVMVAPLSRLVGQAVSEAGMHQRFGVSVLAVQRRGAHLREEVATLVLQVGDILLVQGSPDDLSRLTSAERDLIVLGGTQPAPPSGARAPVAMGLVASALVAAAAGLVPLVVAVLLASVGAVLARCLTASQAYRALNLRILIILGCMLALGQAARESGLAGMVAGHVVDIGGQLGPRGVLAMLYLATLILTELVTNAGTAGIMVPVALGIAEQAGLSHRPFVLAVALGASCSFLTPVGYQTNLLVYGPGGYRLQDYLRLGAPLSLTLWIAAVILLPVFFPFDDVRYTPKEKAVAVSQAAPCERAEAAPSSVRALTPPAMSATGHPASPDAHAPDAPRGTARRGPRPRAPAALEAGAPRRPTR